MRVNHRIAVAVVAAALVVPALAACGGATGSSVNANGVLNVGMPNGPLTDNSNPFLASSAGHSVGYRYMIFEPLVMMSLVNSTDPGKPWLATKWDWSDNYTKLTLTVRDNVKWSDNQPLTADDVAYTFQLLKQYPGLNNDALPFGDISTSGNQVTVTFPSSQYVNQSKIFQDVLVVPKHIWSTMKDPATDPVHNPVGTGPYAVKSFTPQTVTLHVRDNYWQPLPKVQEIRYTSYNDNNAQTTALATGASEWSYVFIPNVNAVYTSKDPAHNKLWFPPNLSVDGLFLNTEQKPFDDPALRRAMSMVINRADIFKQGEAGYFKPQVDSVTGIPTPAGQSFISAQYQNQKFNVDVEGAKKTLADAGYRLSGNTLLDPSGKPVTITLTDPAGWSDYMTDLEIIKDNLATIGITATVDKANEDAWTKNIDTGNFQAAMHWTNNGATPYDMYENMVDGALYKPVGTAGVNGNYGRYRNDAATAALAQYANATDDAGRSAALSTLEQIMVQQMPVIITSAGNLGGEYSTKHWTGWPDDQNPYATGQPTKVTALDVVLHLTPAS